MQRICKFFARYSDSEELAAMSGNMSSGIRSTPTKMIPRAGLERWLKPFHILRASRQTELKGALQQSF
jgi:hypothetical protein